MKHIVSLVCDYLGLRPCTLTMPELTPNLIEIGSRNKVLPMLTEALGRIQADNMPARLGDALRVVSAHEGERVQSLIHGRYPTSCTKPVLHTQYAKGLYCHISINNPQIARLKTSISWSQPSMGR